jgi:hypothetical protein
MFINKIKFNRFCTTVTTLVDLQKRSNFPRQCICNVLLMLIQTEINLFRTKHFACFFNFVTLLHLVLKRINSNDKNSNLQRVKNVLSIINIHVNLLNQNFLQMCNSVFHNYYFCYEFTY